MLSLSVGEVGRSTFMPSTYNESCPFCGFQTVFCFLRLTSLKNGKSSFLFVEIVSEDVQLCKQSFAFSFVFLR